MLPNLFKDFDIVFVENEDRRYYASLNINRFLFVPEKNRDSVFHKSKAGQFKGLVDRDFLSDDDIDLIERQYIQLRILRYYCIENYLFHPLNMKEYYDGNNKEFNIEEYKELLYLEKENLKEQIHIKIASVRQGYPYFKDPGMEKSSSRKRFMPETENFQQSAISCRLFK